MRGILNTAYSVATSVWNSFSPSNVRYTEIPSNNGNGPSKKIYEPMGQYALSAISHNKYPFNWKYAAALAAGFGAIGLSGRTQILSSPVELVNYADSLPEVVEGKTPSVLQGFNLPECDVFEHPHHIPGIDCYAPGGNYYQYALYDPEYAKLWGVIDREYAHPAAEGLMMGVGAYSLYRNYPKFNAVIPGYEPPPGHPSDSITKKRSLAWTSAYVGTYIFMRGLSDGPGMHQYEPGGTDSIFDNWSEWKVQRDLDRDTFTSYLANRLFYAPLMAHLAPIGLNVTSLGYFGMSELNHNPNWNNGKLNQAYKGSRLPLLAGGAATFTYGFYGDQETMPLPRSVMMTAGVGSMLLSAGATYGPDMFLPVAPKIKNGVTIPAHASVKDNILTFSAEESAALKSSRFLAQTNNRLFWNLASATGYGYLTYNGIAAGQRLLNDQSFNPTVDGLLVGGTGVATLAVGDAIFRDGFSRNLLGQGYNKYKWNGLIYTSGTVGLYAGAKAGQRLYYDESTNPALDYALVSGAGAITLLGAESRIQSLRGKPSLGKNGFFKLRTGMSLFFTDSRIGYLGAMTVFSGSVSALGNTVLLYGQGYENKDGLYLQSNARAYYGPYVNRVNFVYYVSKTGTPLSQFGYLFPGQWSTFGPTEAQNQVKQTAGRNYLWRARRYPVSAPEQQQELMQDLYRVEGLVTLALERETLFYKYAHAKDDKKVDKLEDTLGVLLATSQHQEHLKDIMRSKEKEMSQEDIAKLLYSFDSSPKYHKFVKKTLADIDKGAYTRGKHYRRALSEITTILGHKRRYYIPQVADSFEPSQDQHGLNLPDIDQGLWRQTVPSFADPSSTPNFLVLDQPQNDHDKKEPPHYYLDPVISREQRPGSENVGATEQSPKII